MNKTDKLISWLVGEIEDFSILEDMPEVPMPIGHKEREIALKSEEIAHKEEVEEKLLAEFNKDN